MLAAEKQKEASGKGTQHAQRPWGKREPASSKNWGKANMPRMQSEGLQVGEEAGWWASGMGDPAFEEFGFCPRPLGSHERFSAGEWQGQIKTLKRKLMYGKKKWTLGRGVLFCEFSYILNFCNYDHNQDSEQFHQPQTPLCWPFVVTRSSATTDLFPLQPLICSPLL